MFSAEKHHKDLSVVVRVTVSIQAGKPVRLDLLWGSHKSSNAGPIAQWPIIDHREHAVGEQVLRVRMFVSLLLRQLLHAAGKAPAHMACVALVVLVGTERRLIFLEQMRALVYRGGEPQFKSG